MALFQGAPAGPERCLRARVEPTSLPASSASRAWRRAHGHVWMRGSSIARRQP